jgi:hypothetical protein
MKFSCNFPQEVEADHQESEEGHQEAFLWRWDGYLSITSSATKREDCSPQSRKKSPPED